MPIPDPETLRRALEAYPLVIAEQGVLRLPELDLWYREELPRRIAGRDPPFLTLEELVRLTEWKMARGVWRGPNLALVRKNDSGSVEDRSRVAFSRIPHPTAPIAELAKLRGVGPATASAAAAVVAPDLYPFFDEWAAAQLPHPEPIAWTMKGYARYSAALQAAAAGLDGEWSATQLERALWALAREKPGGALG